MSRPLLSCKRCGKRVGAGGPSETAVFDETRRVRSVRRSFRAECAEHGWLRAKRRRAVMSRCGIGSSTGMFPKSVRLGLPEQFLLWSAWC